MKKNPPSLTPTARRAQSALRCAVRRLFRQQRARGTRLAVWCNGRVVLLSPSSRGRAA